MIPPAALLRFVAVLLLGGQAWAADLTVHVRTPGGAPVKDAVVYLVPSRPVDHPPLTAVIDQVKKQFVPRVSVIRTGTAVRFPNSDNIRHSVYSFSPAKTFTLKLYAGQPANPVVFDKPGVVVLGCNIHDQMVAFVLVTDGPNHAVTDETGTAHLPDVPAGEYRLRAWHEPMPAEAGGQPLQVGESGALERTLELDAAAAAAPGAAGPAMGGMPGMKP